MSRFALAARFVLACTAPSSGYAWIAFHRCVEAYSRLSGERFSAVFARLGAAHGFTRGSRVDVANLQAATRELVDARAALLLERERLIAVRRAEKRAGRGGNASPALQRLEGRHRGLTALQPDVGVWGWAALRQGRLGPRVALPLPGAPPVYGGTGQPVFVDLRVQALPEGFAEALTTALSAGRAHRLSLLLGPARLGDFATWASERTGAAALSALGRASWGGRVVLVVSPPPLTPAQERDLQALEQALRPHGWGLRLATLQGG